MQILAFLGSRACLVHRRCLSGPAWQTVALRYSQSAADARYSETSAYCAGLCRLDIERLISLKEAATRFPISYSQLRRLARTRRLQATKLGRDWFTTPEQVAAYLANAELRSKDPHKYKRSC
jgi:hypothetical protein